MRVLMVTPYYYPAAVYGGPVVSVRNAVRTLVASGVEVEVWTTCADEPADRPPGDSEVDGVLVRYHRRWGRGRYFFSPGLAARLSTGIPMFDLVHVQGLWTHPAGVACAIARACRKPFIIAPRGTLDPWALAQKRWKKAVYLALVERNNLAKAAAVQCLTEAEAVAVSAVVPEATCVVVPNAVDLQAGAGAMTPDGTAPLGRDLSGRPTVLFLSRLHSKKGVDALVEAFALVRRDVPSSRLVLAGPSEEGTESRIRAQVRRLDLEDAVTFAGLVVGERKHALLSSAHVLVLPSLSEGLPMAVLEAMAAGVPVVISRACNLSQEVTQYRAGLVVDPTPPVLANAMVEILLATDEARRMGAAGRRLVAERFSLEAVGARTIRLYNAILARHSSAAPTT